MAGEQRKAAEQLQKINMTSCDGEKANLHPMFQQLCLLTGVNDYTHSYQSGQFPGIEFTGSFKGEAQTTEGGREGLELR